ncbi:hypothetical protein BKA61DRAFT_614489 [Leptodontidium sp. MPI-SDFR-AT-0119]|nr:hypothetical protein BKA61DRAFT_614489 [Leptodontidium sp. MPI-SDFR-AT-0119]
MVEDRGPELAAVLGLFLGLSLVFVLLRVYVKTFLSKSWGSDDTLLIVSLITFITYCACSATGVHYGTGRHVTDIPPKDVPKALYYWFLCEIFYAVTTLLIRLSIAVFLLRICIKPLHKKIVYGTSIVMIAFTVFYFFLVIFQCKPTSYFWGQYEGQKGSCINVAAIPNASIAHSALSFTADWILGLLPVALIWDLKMNTRTKVSVGILMSLGLLAGVATMIRVPYIKVLALTDDFLFATTDVAIWSTVEPGLGLCAAGGATLRPLFRKFYNLSTLRSRPTRNTHHRDSHMINLDNQPAFTHASKFSSFSHSNSHSHSHSQPHQRGVTTNIRSPFGDSREAIEGNKGQGQEQGEGSEKMGGIKVHKTVEISRAEPDDSDENSLRGEGESGSESRPRTAKSSWDLV